MLGLRLVSSAAVIGLLSGLLWLDLSWGEDYSGAWLIPAYLGLGMLAAWEVARLVATHPLAPARGLILLGNGVVLAASAVPVLYPLAGASYPPQCPIGRMGWPLLALAGCFSGLLAVEMWAMRGAQPRPAGAVTTRLGLALLTIVYPALFLSLLVSIRLVGGHRAGWFALLTTVAIVKCSDAGAYFAGRALGRTRLAPQLSPGKTVEGAVGGLLAACLAAWGCFWLGSTSGLLDPPVARPALFQQLALGLLLGGAGMLGDLAESLLKRDLRVKDSGSALPGLGGALDVLDSVLIASLPAYLWWIA